jgi:dienelactone hydrolase
VAADDPLRHPAWEEAFAADVRDAGAPLELVEHPVPGHLFTDPSRPDEYDPAATEALWARALPFCRAAAGT